MNIDPKSGFENASHFGLNYIHVRLNFGPHFKLKIVNMHVSKYARRTRHPSKLEPRSENALEKTITRRELEKIT